mmetsp:Transcript_47856/g.89666  ORF Transcript_47856/g.89666 Transcript_47856/m.89666 type:complete len:134 (+) Transcript_47856:254-655(+)
MAHQVNQARLARQALTARMVPKDRQVQMEQLGLQDHLVLQALQAHQAHQDPLLQQLQQRLRDQRQHRHQQPFSVAEVTVRAQVVKSVLWELRLAEIAHTIATIQPDLEYARQWVVHVHIGQIVAPSFVFQVSA